MDGDDGKVRFAKKKTLIDAARGPNSLLHGGLAYLAQPGPAETLVPNDRGMRKFEELRSKVQADFRPGRRRVPHSEHSKAQVVSQKKALQPQPAEEKPARPMKRYFPEKSGFDYPEDMSFRALVGKQSHGGVCNHPMRKVDYPKQGTLQDNPSQVSMEKSFGRKGRVPQQQTDEPSRHKAAVYQTGHFQQENKYLPSATLEATASLTAAQRRFRKKKELSDRALSSDVRTVLELTNNVKEAGQEKESWERRTGMYVWKSKHGT